MRSSPIDSPSEGLEMGGGNGFFLPPFSHHSESSLSARRALYYSGAESTNPVGWRQRRVPCTATSNMSQRERERKRDRDREGELQR